MKRHQMFVEVLQIQYQLTRNRDISQLIGRPANIELLLYGTLITFAQR